MNTSRPADNASPTVSVIMAVRNEQDFIERSIAAILDQDYPTRLVELIVADGMSTDRTRHLIESMAIRDHLDRIRVIDNRRKIVATGLNLALKQALGDVVVRVDGHTMIARDYVQQCVTLLVEGVAENVGGPMVACGSGSVGKAIAVAATSRFGTGGSGFHDVNREGYVDTVYLGAWHRSIFDLSSTLDAASDRQDHSAASRLGQDSGRGSQTSSIRLRGFDETMVRNQDDELNYRLRHLGGRVFLSPKIRSRYFNRGSLRALARQYFGYGFWKPRVLAHHPLQMQPRQFVAPILVVILLVLTPLALLASKPRFMLVAVLVAYLLSTLAASLLVARRNKGTQLLILPAVFATQHVSYGLGFLAGIVESLWHGASAVVRPWRDRHPHEEVVANHNNDSPVPGKDKDRRRLLR